MKTVKTRWGDKGSRFFYFLAVFWCELGFASFWENFNRSAASWTKPPTLVLTTRSWLVHHIKIGFARGLESFDLNHVAFSTSKSCETMRLMLPCEFATTKGGVQVDLTWRAFLRRGGGGASPEMEQETSFETHFCSALLATNGEKKRNN